MKQLIITWQHENKNSCRNGVTWIAYMASRLDSFLWGSFHCCCQIYKQTLASRKTPELKSKEIDGMYLQYNLVFMGVWELFDCFLWHLMLMGTGMGLDAIFQKGDNLERLPILFNPIFLLLEIQEDHQRCSVSRDNFGSIPRKLIRALVSDNTELVW